MSFNHITKRTEQSIININNLNEINKVLRNHADTLVLYMNELVKKMPTELSCESDKKLMIEIKQLLIINTKSLGIIIKQEEVNRESLTAECLIMEHKE